MHEVRSFIQSLSIGKRVYLPDTFCPSRDMCHQDSVYKFQGFDSQGKAMIANELTKEMHRIAPLDLWLLYENFPSKKVKP